MLGVKDSGEQIVDVSLECTVLGCKGKGGGEKTVRNAVQNVCPKETRGTFLWFTEGQARLVR